MRIIRLNEVINRTGLGKTSLYKFIKAKTFPQPIALGERAVGWVEA
ncbi:MAG: AlpA family phage regulatory protein, partial [Acinetobacter sp.]